MLSNNQCTLVNLRCISTDVWLLILRVQLLRAELRRRRWSRLMSTAICLTFVSILHDRRRRQLLNRSWTSAARPSDEA